MIQLVNLSKYYYGNNSVALGLRKINLEFQKGEFVAITGESGSGKTTLLSTISGMLPFEEGEMYFDGNATSYYDEADWEVYRKNHIAFVFQNYNLIDSYTALENVMTSFLIQGEEKKIAKEKSMKLLERVGISEYATHRATELSSGQKQRLSIARALAKNTEVIVADEPTGNLDSENGRQIMELFSELSKEKLVIIVTHNFEEAAPYVTRKIVIHDAEVEEDIQIKETHSLSNPEDVLYVKELSNLVDEDDVEEVSKLQDESNLMESSKGKTKIVNAFRMEEWFSKTAWQFACMNMKSRMSKSVLLTGFLCIVFIASFLFLGNFIANLDDTSTKTYKNPGFYNSDVNRIVVRHPDGSPMKEEDFSFLQGVKHVTYVERYSLVNDICYFSEKGVDYQVTYLDDRKSIYDPPTFREEITLEQFTKFVYSASGLTQEDLRWGNLPKTTNEVVIYAEDESLLGSTIVCYFHNQSDWTKNAYLRFEMTVSGILKESTQQYYFSEKLCQVLNNDALVPQMFYGFKEEKSWQEITYYIDDALGLEGETIAAHSEICGRYGSYEPLYNEMMLRLDDTEMDEWLGVVDINHADVMEPIIRMEHKSSKPFMALSEELYGELFAEIENTQMGVLIKDYAYMEDVLREIRGAGYEAVAPYQIGSVSYDDIKVRERLVTLGLSLIALFVLVVLEVMIVTAFIRNEKNADLILKSIGMKQSVLTKSKAYTLITYAVAAFLLMLLLVFTIGRVIPQVYSLFIYYRVHHLFLLFALGVVAMLITTYLYKIYLMRMLRAGSEVRVS